VADINKLTQVGTGGVRNVDIGSNTLVTTSVKVGGNVSNTDLTKTILDRLVSLQNASDIAATYHTHDTLYTRTSALASTTNGSAGSTLIGDNNSYSNFTPTEATVKGALAGIDTALGSAASALDEAFRIKNTTDNTKQIAFSAAGITTSTTRTVTMPDANVDLGNLTNSNISASAAIALTKLATVTANRAIASNGSGVLVVSSVTDTELGYLSGVTSAIQTQLGGKLSLSGGTMTGAINGGGFQASNFADPSTAQALATKNYVDNAINGFAWKAPVKAASTANLTLSGTQTVDGVALSASDRVLVKDQSTASQNGIYVVAAGAWSRATDMDALTPLDEFNGAAVFVLPGGTANGNKGFTQSANVTTVGSSSVSFVQFSAAGAFTQGNGISISGSTISIALATNPGLQFTSNQLDLLLNGTTLSKGASGLQVATGGITNTEINSSAAIAYSKLALSNSIVAGDITSNAVTTAKINAAAVDKTKLASDVFDQVTITGAAGSSGAVQSSPLVRKTMVAGESFAANTSFLVRYARTGETAGSVYKADKDATSNNNYYVVGIALSTGAVTAGQNITVISLGTSVLGSSDTAFNAADVGKPLFLGASGAFILGSSLANTAGEAQVQIGIIENTDRIWIQPQVIGIA